MILRLNHTQREGPLLQIRGECSVHSDAVQHARPQNSIHSVGENFGKLITCPSRLIARTNVLRLPRHASVSPRYPMSHHPCSTQILHSVDNHNTQWPATIELDAGCSQLPGSLAERIVSNSLVRDLSLLLYSVASLSHLSQITYELSIVMRSFGITKIPSRVVSTSSNFNSVSKPFVTSLHRC